MPARSLGQLAGCELLLKAENLQRAGSFKVRGAANKIAFLSPDQKASGVIAASAGNHAQGVALAASNLGIPCTIVMPTGASIPKVEATRGYGAKVLLQGDDFDQSQRHSRRVMRENGMTLIPAFDDPEIIAGQGTIGLEMLEQVEALDTVVVPVGEGGLISGIGLAIKETSPGIKVIGVQAEAATAVADSYKANRRITVKGQATVADGIAVGTPGRITLPLVSRYVDDMVVVEEDEITQAMMLLLERGKLLVEGAGAVGLAAVLGGRIQVAGKKAAVVLSGGQRGRSPDSAGRGARSGPRRPLPRATHHVGGPSRSVEPSAEHHIQHRRECAGHRPSQACPIGALGPSRDPAYSGD